MAEKLSGLGWVARILVIIGAINWGLAVFGGFNLVTAIVGVNVVADIIYALVGLSGIWELIALFR